MTRFLSPIACAALLACSPDPYPGEQGAVLHAAVRTLPKSFDPAMIEDQSSGIIAAPVYEGLLEYHPFARPYRLEPALAAAMPEVSEDGRTYTFTLRQGVTFHDDPCFEGGEGREVTAEDVVFDFKRFAHPSTRTKGWWLFDGWVEGMNEWRDQLTADLTAEREKGGTPGPLWGMERDIPGLRAVDRYTVEITLTKPYPQFLWVLAMGYTSIYPREAVEHYGAEFRNHPVGTGPFRLKSYNPVYRAVFERNPEYREVTFPDPENNPEERWEGWEQDRDAGHLAKAGERMPLLDGMEMRFILEDQPRWLYFKNGYADFLNPPKDNVAEAIPTGDVSEALKERGVTIEKWTELGTVYTCLNTEDELLSNVDVRRAMALAFDHKWTVEHLYGGQAIVARSLIPPGVAGFTDYHPYHSESGEADVERAKQVLARAGYPGGKDPETGRAIRVTFESSGSGVTQRHFAQRYVDEMRRIGIEVDVVVNTFPQMMDKMRKKQFQVAGLAWGFDYPDAQNILQLLYGPNAAPGIGSANFKNTEFDALYEEASVMGDSPERTELYEQMARIVSDEVPWITRTHRIRPNLQHPWLHGFKYTEVNYDFWGYAWDRHRDAGADGARAQQARALAGGRLRAGVRRAHRGLGPGAPMTRFLVRRLAYSIPVLLGVAFITLYLFHIAGGDPVAIKLGKNPNPADVAALRAELGLEGGLLKQYLEFLRQTVTFDFGRSWADDTPVREIFARGLLPTLTVSIPAFTLGAMLSVSISLVVAFYRGSLLDRTVTALAIAGISISSLIYILVGQAVLADRWKLFPIWGYEYGPGAIFFVALPVLIWIAVSVGTDVRYFRTVVLEEISKDYVRTARAKGLSEAKVLFKHVLTNSALPIITRLTIALPFLITGSFLLEVFFGIPGLGATLFTAIQNSDLPVVKAFTMVGAVLYVAFNVLADLLYAYFDPRIRLS